VLLVAFFVQSPKIETRYLDGPSQKKRAPERDLYSLKRLQPFFRERVLQSLDSYDIEAYIESRHEEGVTAGTINKELNLLSAALGYAKRRLRWNVPNPVEGMRLTEPEGRIRWITADRATQLVSAAQHIRGYLADFIVLGLYTGMRKGEMLNLEWRRVDLKEDLIYLENTKDRMDQKNGKYGSISINKAARQALLSRLNRRLETCPGCPWVFANGKGERIANIRKGFQAACQKAGIEDFHPHDLRHTCATWLVQSGVPIREVSELLRHSDIRITMRYAHLAPENVRGAVDHFKQIVTF